MLSKQALKVLDELHCQNLIEDGKSLLRISKWKQVPSKVFDKNKEKKGYSQAFFKHKLDRIHIGIACEHFLKALFLNKGYAIYEYELKIPLEIDNPEKGIKRKNKTISFDFMIQHIPKIISLTGENLNKFKEGLSIIKDWRNNEAHNSNNVVEDKPEEHALTYDAIKILIKEIKKIKSN
ncbi:TPA: hypothetical protein HA281_04030 [Candidatus Woesearchaeota archaeon]|nr:hypothetical protein [Candidatus Woesearchaeota archaeon]HIH91947.1 hypothetical protein [Candidatus Woesearchaeota archaeon]HII63899.1 hypothetical protein [Candidatus Woesearchaeota archaeon]